MIGPSLPPGGLSKSNHSQDDQAKAPTVPLASVADLPFMSKTDMGAGLSNLGNSCFMNSVLQCLAYVPPLTITLQKELLHGFDAKCPLSAFNKPCAACLVEDQLCHQLSKPSHVSVRPGGVFGHLKLFSKTFVRGRQEDAHEFLVTLLDAVERDSRRGLVMYRHPKTTRTMIEHLFCGRTQSQVQCLECGHCSNMYETLTCLSLDLVKGVHTVEQGLAHCWKEEMLDGANKYKCDKCNKLVPARKSLSIYDEPNVLVIHLKRFNPFSLSAKINRHIGFGLGLTLPARQQPHHHHHQQQQQNGHGAPQTNGARVYGPAPPPANGHANGGHHHASNGGSSGQANGAHHHASHGSANGHANGDSAGSCGSTGTQYLLTGVVVHSGGSVHSGHYYAYVRASTGQWYCANDQHVEQVRFKDVLEEQAYLLFYARVSSKLKPLPPPPPPPDAAGSPAAPTPAPAPLKPTCSLDHPAPTSPRAAGHTAPSPHGADTHADTHHGSPRASRLPSGSWTQVQQTPSHEPTTSVVATAKPAVTTKTTHLTGQVPRIVLLPRSVQNKTQQRPDAQPGTQQPAPAATTDAAEQLPRKRSREEQSYAGSGAQVTTAHAEHVRGLQRKEQVPAADSLADPQPAWHARQGNGDEHLPKKCKHAESLEQPGLREVCQVVFQQLYSELRSTPGCLEAIRSQCMAAQQQGLSMEEFLSRDPGVKNALVSRFLAHANSRSGLVVQVNKQLRDALTEVSAAEQGGGKRKGLQRGNERERL